MPNRKARAKSPAHRRRRPPSEWNLLGRYLRQMTGQDLDNYARLIATLKDRFTRLDDREVWDRLHFEEGCIGMEMHQLFFHCLRHRRPRSAGSVVGGGSAVIPARRECFVVNSAGRRLSSSVGMQFRPSPAIATLQFNDLEIVN